MVSLLTSLRRTMTERPAFFTSQDRTDSSREGLLTIDTPRRSFFENLLSKTFAKTTGHGVPGCRLLQAVAATHVCTRTITHARTPGTIPSSRCQTTRRRPIFGPLRISFPMDENKAPDWWSQSGSNRRPHACKARALPAELWPLSQMLSNRPRRATVMKQRRGRQASQVSGSQTEAASAAKTGGPGKT